MPSPTRAAMRIGSGPVLAAALAACAGSATSSPRASDGDSAAPPTATAAQTDAAQPTSTTEATPAVSVAVPSLGANTPLVDILPAELGGAATQKLAVDGSDLSALDSSAVGASSQEIGDAMIAARTLNATTTKDELDLGGKHVVKVTTTIAPVPFYVYGTGDVSITIAGTDETIVAEALAKLP